ncbi:hypothetical protein S7711_07782 [Stachybotrys chartarum IBT 7711]|uniref:Uncharacterized protein n=1 Tax=Stachybotrys chartarum (strain CBS 109288 / IBT 7711) TaxID=1280523 RepID=A0A084ASM9_STACB|nr:hypothetical protein S7711_07782 [Stachybotrys chartarum IBT 7711]KFA49746.1 hypothetical protein S40293_01428 [Stachybotrys chartarum IBT 40293]
MPPRSQHQPSHHELHVVVLGAGGVGKSCLTAQFVHHEWIESYDPTIEDSYRTHLMVDSNSVGHDPSQMSIFKLIPFLVAMRDLYMKTGQGFLLVFSITSASSLEELGNLRDEIIRIKDDENVPMVIVGNKADLEENRAVPRAKGFSVSQRWGSPYYETSARSRTNVDEVFVDLCRQMLRKEDEAMQSHGDSGKYDGSGSHSRRRRRRRMMGESGRCIIL